MSKLHRNSQKRIYLDNAVYFITFRTHDNFSYFQEQIFCDLFLDELKLCVKMKQFELYAFNVLYDHVHLLLKPSRKYNISKIMKSLKENASRDINYVITGRYNVGDTSTCRLYMRGFINECRKKFVNQYGTNQIHFPPFKWQRSFHDHVIRNEKDFANHYNYIVYNHQKYGLPEDWKYTSLNSKKAIFISAKTAKIKLLHSNKINSKDMKKKRNKKMVITQVEHDEWH